jgi:hypothetical protein
MGETSPRVWFEKIDFIEQYHGMALNIVHPDYSGEGKAKEIYNTFLSGMRERTGFWHAIPREVVSWWKRRKDDGIDVADNPILLGHATLIENNTRVLISTVKDDFLTSSKKLEHQI